MAVLQGYYEICEERDGPSVAKVAMAPLSGIETGMIGEDAGYVRPDNPVWVVPKHVRSVRGEVTFLDRPQSSFKPTATRRIPSKT